MNREPNRRSAFDSGGQGFVVVEVVDAPAPDVFSYRIKDREQSATIHFGETLARAK
jgi:hypothetical protein